MPKCTRQPVNQTCSILMLDPLPHSPLSATWAFLHWTLHCSWKRSVVCLVGAHLSTKQVTFISWSGMSFFIIFSHRFISKFDQIGLCLGSKFDICCIAHQARGSSLFCFPHLLQNLKGSGQTFGGFSGSSKLHCISPTPEWIGPFSQCLPFSS